MPRMRLFYWRNEMSAFDPKKYQVAEEKADKFLDKIKGLGFTALILIGAALLVIGFALV